jgi:hypothetical protein
MISALLKGYISYALLIDDGKSIGTLNRREFAYSMAVSRERKIPVSANDSIKSSEVKDLHQLEPGSCPAPGLRPVGACFFPLRLHCCRRMMIYFWLIWAEATLI